MTSIRPRVDRDQIRALVRAELEARIGSGAAVHAALGEILLESSSECAGDAEMAPPRPCVIEPDRPCYDSGYCRKLGY